MEKRQTINVKPNKDGRCIIELFGQEIEIDKSMFDKNGVAELKKFGGIYEIKKPVKKTRKTTKPKKIEVEEIEESES